jgi:uncharacterized coiled-coil protein SlyX
MSDIYDEKSTAQERKMAELDRKIADNNRKIEQQRLELDGLFRKFMNLAQQGDKEAMETISGFYRRGTHPCSKDDEKADYWDAKSKSE